jgi:MFS transporter, DHA1 family, multidrug resistance protein
MIELMEFRPIEVGFFFAGTVLVVFAAGLIGNRMRERIGLDQSMQIALLLCGAGSVAVLAAALVHGSFLPFLGASLIFLLGMGVVNPLGTAPDNGSLRQERWRSICSFGFYADDGSHHRGGVVFHTIVQSLDGARRSYDARLRACGRVLCTPQ